MNEPQDNSPVSFDEVEKVLSNADASVFLDGGQTYVVVDVSRHVETWGELREICEFLGMKMGAPKNSQN